MINNVPDSDVDKLMQRLQTEAERYRPRHSSEGRMISQPIPTDGFGASLPQRGATQALEEPIPDAIHLVLQEPSDEVDLSAWSRVLDRKCTLQELLAYQDRAFIHAAYWAMLHREADAGGFETYLRLLRNGTSKIAVLDLLRRSEEGRGQPAILPGLSFEFMILSLSRLPILGGLVRLIQTIWGLPGTQRRQRATEGHICALIEQAQEDSRQSIRVANRALRDLARLLNELTTYAASKASRVSITNIVRSEDLGRSLDEVYSSLQMLQSTKAPMSEVTAVKAALDAASLAVKSLQSGKADTALVDKVHQEFTHGLQMKSDRNEVSALIATARSESAHASARLMDLKADSATLDELQDSFLHAMQAKADRHELTGLTNHLVDLMHTRLEGSHLAPLEQSVAALSHQAQSDRARVDASLDALRESLTDLAGCKADQRGLATAVAEVVLRMNVSMEQISKRITKLSTTKLERADLEMALEEGLASLEATRRDHNVALHSEIEIIRETIRSIERSKADLSALDSAQIDARQRIDTLHVAINQEIAAVAASKANRTAVESAIRETVVSIQAARSDHQTSLQAAIESSRESLQAISCSKADLQALESAQTEAKLRMDRALEELNDTVNRLSMSKADRTALETALGETRILIQTTRKDAHEALQNTVDPVANQTRDVKRNLIEQERRLGLLLDEVRKRLPKPLSAGQLETMLTEDEHLLDAMYAGFEDMFRGTREDIKQRQSIYLPYVQTVKAGTASAPIVDIGCGRGEWLELLADAGLKGRGVDLNRIFLQRCRELNLDVVESDGIAFLRELPPNSLGAITSFHLIEHLPHKVLIALLDSAVRTLRPGGLAIFETPNPRNLQVASCNFYMDPTHRNPLPPDLMRYLLEARGFVQVEIIELHPSPGRCISEGAPAVAETLNRLLFSAQDFAVIGKKPR